ncbi:TonB-dependent receptor domain-containing protein [Rugamonas rubra]|uniref:TonB-dependent receptor domain-containing protein n=1 Tax=Rugamonas rubra TaxID=758825 RepID=UPI000B865D43|nr:TonB-dependent receptor [Rugamonas rubra]
MAGNAIGVVFATAASAAGAQGAPPGGEGEGGATANTKTNAASASASAAGSMAVVEISGTRTMRDGSLAPTPVTVVTAEQLNAASPGTIASALSMLPVFRGSTTPASGNVSSTGPNSGAFLNLRNLGAQRTLVLIDGRRAAPSAVSGATDTNLLPQELVKRVDIVTGGASAAYGSDAVAGVVNFILDTRFKGIKGSVQGGQSNYDDNRSRKFTLTGGSDFNGGRGRVVASAAYYRADGVDSTLSRPFGARAGVVLPDPANPAQNILVTNYHNTVLSPGGLLFGGAGIGMGTSQFGPAGAVRPFSPGSIVDGVQVGGEGLTGQTNLIAGVKSHSAFTHVEYDLGADLTVFAEGSLGGVNNRYPQTSNFQLPGYNSPTFMLGNPFIPAALQATMLANKQPGFQIGRFDQDMPTSTADATNRTSNFVTGFRWRAPNNWKVDGYWEHGKNRQTINTENNLNYARFFAATDVVSDPVGGAPVCRVALTHPGLYPGCAPLNLFGAGAPSAAATAYVQGVSTYTATLKQDVAALTVRGAPFELPAGDVRVASGVEYRKESVAQTTDATSVTPVAPTGLRQVPSAVLGGAGGWQLTNPQPLGGSYQIREGFVEVDAPLLAERAFAKELNVNAALRYADYSTSGGVTTSKIGLTWAPVNELRLRAAKSRDIRAPNVSELFSGSVQGQATVRDTINNVAANAVVSQLGNPDLRPEKANTVTYGLVYQPSFVSGLSLALDHFSIDLGGVIGALTPQETINKCAAGVPEQCANLIWTNPAARTGLIRVLMPQRNLSSLKTSGYDVELSYRAKASKLWPALNGELTLRAFATYLDAYTTTSPGSAPLEYAGVVGTSNNPRLTATLSADYRNGPLGVYLQLRHIGRAKFQAATEYFNPALADNSVPSIRYVDATLNYQLPGRRGVQLFATVNNLFNKQPPLLPVYGSFNLMYPTNPSVYDVVGRYISAGVRFQF